MNNADNDNDPPAPWGPFRDPLTLSDEHLNQSRRFAGLPPLDAKERATQRGYLRWMKERFGQRPNSDKPPKP